MFPDGELVSLKFKSFIPIVPLLLSDVHIQTVSLFKLPLSTTDKLDETAFQVFASELLLIIHGLLELPLLVTVYIPFCLGKVDLLEVFYRCLPSKYHQQKVDLYFEYN